MKIEQLAIPETTYGQFITTQLMGGTARDILQAGQFVPYNVMLGYHARYLVPLTDAAKRHNPDNAGTDLADKPWLQTYKDRMRNRYVTEVMLSGLVVRRPRRWASSGGRARFVNLTGDRRPLRRPDCGRCSRR